MTEDIASAVTGTGDLGGTVCQPSSLTIAGTNNTGGVADSVELTISHATFNPFTFNGNFDSDGSYRLC